MKIEIAYVVNPNFEIALFNSIRSLILSKTTFDQITIYCVGPIPNHWKFKDPRISVAEVTNFYSDFFLGNKVYGLQSEADILIYLDADTLVLKPIDLVYQNCKADFIGKQDSLLDESVRQELWNTVLCDRNLSVRPYFNSGFFIVQNSFQARLFEAWKVEIEFLLANQSEVIRLHEKEGYPQSLCRHFSEQLALSLALGNGASFKEMKVHQHAFGWKEASDDDAVVYHTGSPHYSRLSMLLQHKYDLFGKSLPQQTLLLNPIVVKRLKNRMRFQWKQFKQGISHGK